MSTAGRSEQRKQAGGVRRSERLSLSLPVQVQGTDLSGQDFLEKAFTKQLARYGGSITINRSLAPDDVVTVRLMTGQPKEVQARVVGQVGLQAEGHVYGFAFVNEHETFWGIHFPPLAEDEDFITKVLLECITCNQHELVTLNEGEFEVFEANDRIVRSCPSCRQSTPWRQATFERAEQAPALPSFPGELGRSQVRPAGEPAPPPPAWPASDLRRRPRVKVSLKGCILLGTEEELVVVHDMSRGGIRFQGQKQYGVEQWVQVAVPYTIAGANMFRPGRIVWRKESGVTAFEYGLKFVKS